MNLSFAFTVQAFTRGLVAFQLSHTTIRTRSGYEWWYGKATNGGMGKLGIAV
jgi:hypothetical protein